MAHCVITTTNDFKKLYKEVYPDKVSKEDKVILAAYVSIWQEKNGLDKFPTKADIFPVIVKTFNQGIPGFLGGNGGLFDQTTTTPVQLTPEQQAARMEEETQIKDIADKLRNKVKTALNVYRKNPRYTALLEDLKVLDEQFDFYKDDDELSVALFIEHTHSYLDKAFSRFAGFKTRLKEKENKGESLTKSELEQYSYEFKEIKELIHLYESLDAIDLLTQNPDYSFDVSLSDEAKIKLKESLYRKNSIKQNLQNMMIEVAAEFLMVYGESINANLKSKGKDGFVFTKEKLKESLRTAQKDVGFGAAHFNAAISSSDDVMALTALAIKDSLRDGEIEDFAVYEKMISALNPVIDEVQELGDSYFDKYIRDIEVERMVKDEKGEWVKTMKPTKAIITPFNEDVYEKEKQEIYEKAQDLKDRGFDTLAAEIISRFFQIAKPMKTNYLSIIEERKSTLNAFQFRSWIYGNTTRVKTQAEVDNLRLAGRLIVYENPFMKDKAGKPIKEYRRANSTSELVTFSDKYKNKDFDDLYKNDALFKELYDAYEKANSQLPFKHRLKVGAIPQIAKGSNKSLKEKIEALKTRYNEVNPDVENIGLDGKTKREVTTGLNGYVDVDNLNTNLVETLLAFSQMSNKFKALYDIEDSIGVIQALIQDDPIAGIQARKALESNGMVDVNGVLQSLTKTKETGNRVNEQLNKFINDVMFVESEDIENFGGFNINKIASDIGTGVALQSMALNFSGGFIGNKLQGNMMANYKEAVGGRFFNQKQYHEADFEYKRNTSEFIGDLGRLHKSKFNRLAMRFDAIQGEFKDSYGNNVTGSLASKLFTRNSLFFLNHTAEHQIQVTAMIAMMKGYPLANGETLYDAFDDEGNVKSGYEKYVTKELEKAFTNRLHAVNKMLHGNYNDFDKAAIQRKWWGKQIMMFRKFIPTAIASRFGEEYVDVELGDTMEGYYRSFIKTFKKDFAEFGIKSIPMLLQRFSHTALKTLTFGNVEIFKDSAKGNLSDDQFYYYCKTMYDVLMLIAVTIVIAGIKSYEPDDEDKFLYNSVKLQALRFKKDVEQFMPPFGFNDFFKTLQSPAASVSVIVKYGDFFGQLLNPTEQYTRNSGWAEKGDYKLYIKFQKLIPIWRQIISTLTPEEQVKFYNK